MTNATRGDEGVDSGRRARSSRRSAWLRGVLFVASLGAGACGGHPDAAPVAANAPASARTSTALTALPPQFYETVPAWNSTINSINNAGKVAGAYFSTSSPFMIAFTGAPGNAPTTFQPWGIWGPTSLLAVNEQGFAGGTGGPWGTDYQHEFLVGPNPTQTVTLIPEPVNSWSPSGYEPDKFVAMSNSPGPGLPDVIGAVQTNAGALGVWHLDGNGNDEAGSTSMLNGSLPHYDTGKIGQAQIFDGTSCAFNYNGTADAAAYDFDGLTMMAWIKLDPNACTGEQFQSIVQRGFEYSMSVTCDSAGPHLSHYFWNASYGSGHNNYVAPGALRTGDWVHVAVSWDRHHVRTYVDGMVTDTEELSGDIVSGGNVVSIGCFLNTNTNPWEGEYRFRGAIDEVQVFKQAMGADQILGYSKRLGSIRLAPSTPNQGATEYSVKSTQWTRYRDGFREVITQPAGAPYAGTGEPMGMTDSGVILGYADLLDGSTAAMMYTPGHGIQNVNELVDPAVAMDWNLRKATSMSDDGIVVGAADHAGRHTIYKLDVATHEITDIGIGLQAPYDDPTCRLSTGRINSSGHVNVTLFDAADNPLRAMAYMGPASGLVDLNNLVSDPGAATTLVLTNSINDHDVIVGYSTKNGTDTHVGFQMTLQPSAAEDCAGKAEGDSCVHGKWCGDNGNNVCHNGVCGGGNAVDAICLVTPAATCTYDVGDGTSRGLFGYASAGSTNIHIPPGQENHSTIVGQDASTWPTPPAWFVPGLQRGAFVMSYPTGGTATWNIGTHTATTVGAVACTVESGADGIAALFSTGSGPQLDGRVLLVPNPAFGLTGAIVPTETTLTDNDRAVDRTLLADPNGPGPIGARAAGAIPAEFHVTDDGAAQYELPIVTPPGRAGIEPHLRLVYNSRAGDGALGVGWTIAGLSKIARCNRTRADALQEGNDSRAVQFTSDDELCMDGEHLVKIGNGSTGLGEYRTQRDTFAKILVTAADPGTGVPRQFDVYRANGRIESYGSNDSSRVDTTQRVVTEDNQGHPQWTTNPVRAAWYLSQIADRFGNALTISYVRYFAFTDFSFDLPSFFSFHFNVSIEMESMPDEIRYTSNSVTHRTSDRSLKFHYKNYRAGDLSTVATSGWVRARAKIISSIDVNGPNPTSEGLVRQYRFTYGASATNHQTLVRVQLCDGLGACQAPTEFTYQSSTPAFQKIDTGIGDAYLAQAQVPDDRIDSRLCVAFGTCTPNPSRYVLQNASRMMSVGDIDGDGLDDLAYRINAPPGPFAAGDVAHDPAYVVRFSNGAGFGGAVATGFPGPNAAEFNSQFFPRAALVDLNSDGRADVVVPHRTSGGGAVDENIFLATGSKQAPFTSIPFPLTDPRYTDPALNPEFYKTTPTTAFLVADLTGDGRSEFIRDLSIAQEGRMGYRIGAVAQLGPYLPVQITQHGNLQQEPVWFDELNPRALDLDGDGRAELLYTDAYGGDGLFVPIVTGGLVHNGNYVDDHYTIARADANGIFAEYSNLPASPAPSTISFIDYNGDGLKDALIKTSPVQASTSLWMNTGKGFVQGPTVDDRIAKGTITDFDGDGLEDIAYVSCPNVAGAAYVHPTVFLSNGNGTFTTKELTSIPAATSPGLPQSNYPCLATLMDVNGDGLPDILQAEEDQPSLQLYINTGKAADKLASVVNGTGSTVSIEYAIVAATADVCHFPEECGRKVQVVSAYEKDNGTGGDTQSRNRFTLAYTHPVTDLLGRGWQGFGAKKETNQQTGQTTTLTFNLTRVNGFYPYAGMVESETVDTPLTSTGGAVRKYRQVQDFLAISGEPLSGPPFAIRPHTTTEFEFSSDTPTPSWNNVPPIVSRVITDKYDSFGNLTSRNVSSVNAFRTTFAEDTTEYTYAQDTNAWLISQPRSLTRHSTGPNGEVGVDRQTTFETYLTSGQVHFTHIEPTAGSSDEKLDIETVIDGDGNVRSVTATDTNGNSRTESMDYDSLDATFPAAIKNAMDHSTAFTYHQGLGVLVQKTEPNQSGTSWTYDGLGRVRQERPTSGPATELHYVRTSNNQGQSVGWKKTGGGLGGTTFDSLGRPVSLSAVGFDSQIRSAVTTYDRNSGNIASRSLPSVAGMGATTTIDYDEVGRPITIAPAGEQPRFIRYSSLAKTTYQGADFATSIARSIDLRDEWGRTTSSENILDQSHLPPGRPSMAGIRATITEFEYGPFGLLRHVYNHGDSQTVTTEDQYDRLGRRILLIDPDAGTRKTQYNAFGDVRVETDAMGVDTLYDPDPLGRPRSITKGTATDAFNWDSSPGFGGLGQIGSTQSASNVSTQNTYDGIGRLSDQTTYVDGAPFAFHFVYDPTTSKLSQVLYPAVTADGRVGLTYTYDPSDGLASQIDITHETQPIWKKTAVSDAGFVSGEALGNGEKSVHDYDIFTGRLMHIAAGTGASVSGPSGYMEPANSVQSLSYAYDELGRVHSKTDWIQNTGEIYSTYDNFDRLVTWTNLDTTKSVTYDYSDLGNIKARRQTTNIEHSDESYTYGVSAGPHAVTSGPFGSYGYDGNGRQTSRPNQPLLVYNRFDLPDLIQQGNAQTFFQYDATGTRVKKQTGSYSTTYAGGLYERRTGPAGEQHIFYVPGASGPIAQLECTGSYGAATCGSFSYLHSDRVGTVDTVSSPAGVVHSSRDPYGRANGGFGDVTLGFTGEEDDADLGFVNLNHRLYDPKLGRFISPDPLVGFVFSAQDHNRYAYALNSPTMFTDRTGLQESTEFDVTQCSGCGEPWGPITSIGTNVWVSGPDTVGGVQAGNSPDPSDAPPPSAAGLPDVAPDGTNANTNTTTQPDTSSNDGRSSMQVDYHPPGDKSSVSRDWLTGEAGKFSIYVPWPEGSDVQRLLQFLFGTGSTVAAPAAGVLSKFASDPARLNVLQQIYQNGLRTSQTVANQLAGPRSYIPVQSILETVGSGMRSVDPEGVANQFMYQANVSMLINGKVSAGVLEVLINESSMQIFHVLYRSGMSLQ